MELGYKLRLIELIKGKDGRKKVNIRDKLISNIGKINIKNQSLIYAILGIIIFFISLIVFIYNIITKHYIQSLIYLIIGLSNIFVVITYSSRYVMFKNLEKTINSPILSESKWDKQLNVSEVLK